eukprot:5579345-Ditylum_brightwellii.AAC.1
MEAEPLYQKGKDKEEKERKKKNEEEEKQEDDGAQKEAKERIEHIANSNNDIGGKSKIVADVAKSIKEKEAPKKTIHIIRLAALTNHQYYKITRT